MDDVLGCNFKSFSGERPPNLPFRWGVFHTLGLPVEVGPEDKICSGPPKLTTALQTSLCHLLNNPCQLLALTFTGNLSPANVFKKDGTASYKF